MNTPIRVTVWNEFRHEKRDTEKGRLVKSIYPDGIHTTLAKGLNEVPGIKAGTATLDEPDHGLTDDVLAATDVMLWWGHTAHQEVRDEIVGKVYDRVLEGMGLIVLHSGHYSKIFRKLMGTHCSLLWREADEREILWNIAPCHPICEGVPDQIVLPHHEMYGERFDIPEPQETLFISWYEGGNVFRSGCTFKRGNGKIFYFSPGHETYPVYADANIRKVIANGVRWAHSPSKRSFKNAPNDKNPLAPIKGKS
jgi:trehalose utilization protein